MWDVQLRFVFCLDHRDVLSVDVTMKKISPPILSVDEPTLPNSFFLHWPSDMKNVVSFCKRDSWCRVTLTFYYFMILCRLPFPFPFQS